MGPGTIVAIVMAVLVLVGLVLAQLLCKRYGQMTPEEREKE